MRPAERWAVTAMVAATVTATVAGFTPLPVPRNAPGPRQEAAPPGTPDVHCTSTKGEFTIEMHPEWAPIGAKRFLDIVGDGGLDGTVIYRVVRNEAVQFGFIKDEAVRDKYNHAPNLVDDPQIFSNPNFHRGMISFAGAGPNTRGVDVFITFMTGNANGTPRAPWETPFGIVDEAGLKAVTAFNPEYGDFKSFGGNAPELGRGYESFKKSHPNIDYLGKCTLVYPATTAAPTAAAPPSAHAGRARQEADMVPPVPPVLSRNRGLPVEPSEPDEGDAGGHASTAVLVVAVVVVLLVLRRVFARRRKLF